MSDFVVNGFPYYYIGVDSWTDEAVINTLNLSHFTEGFLGAVPWRPSSQTSQAYRNLVNTEAILNLLNISEILFEQFMNTWNILIKNKPNYLFNLTVPGASTFYGYDTVFFIANALHRFDKMYGLLDFFANFTHYSNFIFFV